MSLGVIREISGQILDFFPKLKFGTIDMNKKF